MGIVCFVTRLNRPLLLVTEIYRIVKGKNLDSEEKPNSPRNVVPVVINPTIDGNKPAGGKGCGCA